MTDAVPPRLHSLGEAALLCELPAPASLAQQQQIWALSAEATHWRGVREAVPGMNNLTLLFDPDAAEPTLLRPGDRVRFVAESVDL